MNLLIGHYTLLCPFGTLFVVMLVCNNQHTHESNIVTRIWSCLFHKYKQTLYIPKLEHIFYSGRSSCLLFPIFSNRLLVTLLCVCVCVCHLVWSSIKYYMGKLRRMFGTHGQSFLFRYCEDSMNLFFPGLSAFSFGSIFSNQLATFAVLIFFAIRVCVCVCV